MHDKDISNRVKIDRIATHCVFIWFSSPSLQFLRLPFFNCLHTYTCVACFQQISFRAHDFEIVFFTFFIQVLKETPLSTTLCNPSGQHYLCQVRIKCFRRPTTARPSLRTLKSKETFRPRDNFQLQDISVLSEPGPSNFTLFRFKSVFAAALTFCVRLFVYVRDLRSILGQPWLRRLPLQPCHRLRSTNLRLVTVSSFSYFFVFSRYYIRLNI